MFEGLRGERVAARELTPEQKRRRVVLKRVNMDGTDVRRDFLAGGTMAKGAAETGKAEAYMNARIMRDPIVRRRCAAVDRTLAELLHPNNLLHPSPSCFHSPSHLALTCVGPVVAVFTFISYDEAEHGVARWCCSVAEYEGEFVADASDGGFLRGTQWLVWKFESDATLADACQVHHCFCQSLRPAWSFMYAPAWSFYVRAWSCDESLTTSEMGSDVTAHNISVGNVLTSFCKIKSRVYLWASICDGGRESATV